MSRVNIVWGASLIIPTELETHQCIRAVYYCRRCDHLFIPPLVVELDADARACGTTSITGYALMTPQLACYHCHSVICGGWLAALLSVIHP